MKANSIDQLNEEILANPIKQAREFSAKYNHDPIAAADFCGTVMGHFPTMLNHFLRRYAEQVFETCRLCDRIDYLYLHPDCKPIDRKVFSEAVRFGIENDGIWLRNIDSRYRNMGLLLLRCTEGDVGSYSLRLFDDSDQPASLLCDIWGYLPSMKDALGTTQIINEREYPNFVSDESGFWSFRRQGQRVRFQDSCEAVLYPKETKLAALFVVWATNMLGFQKSLKKA